MAGGHHGDSSTNKPAIHDDRDSPLSVHWIMLIRPQQALPLAGNISKLLILNILFKYKAYTHHYVTYIRKKKTIHTFFILFHIFSRPSYLTHCRGSKLAFLHRVKERKTPSLSAQASFAPFSLYGVVWKIPYCTTSH